MRAICAGSTTKNDVVHQSLEQYREVYVRATAEIHHLKNVSPAIVETRRHVCALGAPKRLFLFVLASGHSRLNLGGAGGAEILSPVAAAVTKAALRRMARRGTWSSGCFLSRRRRRCVGIIALHALALGQARWVRGTGAWCSGIFFQCRWCAANPLSELCRGNVLASVDPPSRSASARESGMWDDGMRPNGVAGCA